MYNLSMKKVVMSVSWAFAILLVLFAVFIASISHGKKADPDAGMTRKDWLSHKKELLSLSAILVEPSVHRMYALALSSKEDLSRCEKSGCSEARHLMREIIGASEDGVITPKEAQELINTNKYFRYSVSKYDEKFK